MVVRHQSILINEVTVITELLVEIFQKLITVVACLFRTQEYFILRKVVMTGESNCIFNIM